MKTLTNALRNTVRVSTTSRATEATLVRSFVETGDERCPLAGVWMRLAESAAPSDDPELRVPAVGDSLWRRAFHFRFNALQYSTS